MARRVKLPNPPVHINLARRAADLLRHDTIDANMGYYLLGSTSPDIRVITRKDRACYHFARLDFEEVGTGINGLFHHHPELLDAEAQSGATQAFMAGYLTHLMADETWITNMFRPFFGNQAVFEDGVVGLVMDRAMQLELDRRCWEEISPLGGLLDVTVEQVQVDFIPPETLADWVQWVTGNLNRGFSWERLRFMARRIARGEENHPAHELADVFVNDASDGLERIYEYIPRGSEEEYHEAALASLTNAIEDYLP